MMAPINRAASTKSLARNVNLVPVHYNGFASMNNMLYPELLFLISLLSLCLVLRWLLYHTDKSTAFGGSSWAF